MGAVMCKEVSPGAGVGGVGKGETWASPSGGCRVTVDRALERVLRRKSQVVQGKNLTTRQNQALNNGANLGSSSVPAPILLMDQAKKQTFETPIGGSRLPISEDGRGSAPSLPPRNGELKVSGSPPQDEPPVRPPRRKDRLRRPNLALPRRNQSAACLSREGNIPEEAAVRLENYLKRCHSMGTVPLLVEELRVSANVSSLSSLSSSIIGSSAAEVQEKLEMKSERLPSFASVTPPPSPEEGTASPTLPHFFIGSRGRSASSSSAQDPSSPMNPYVDSWSECNRGPSSVFSTATDAENGAEFGQGPILRDDGDGMHDFIRKLRRVRSQGDPDSSENHHRRHHHHHHHHHHHRDHGVEPLMEHVIDILPTRGEGPTNISLGRTYSSPQIATGKTNFQSTEEDRNNPRTILLKILGEYHCLPGSGALARAGKRGEEEELAALEKQLDARWAYIGSRKTRVNNKRKIKEENQEEDGKEKDKKTKNEGGEIEDSDDSSSVTPSLGELEEALAHMLDEDDWEEKEEERVIKVAEERAKEVAMSRAEGESLSLKMKRENTFTALSALSRDE